MARPAIAYPLVAVGIGAVGRRVVSDLADTANARPSGEALEAVEIDPQPRLGLVTRDGVSKALERLLEAGRVQGAGEGRARLDLVVAAHLSEVSPAAVQEVVRSITDLLADEYAVLFPPDTPHDKRSAWMSVVLGTPVPTTELFDQLEGLETWAMNDARHPALSRVWLLPTQTTSGKLTDEALEQSMRLFLQGLHLSGVREDDAIRARLAHRPDRRLFATFSVAAAEVPVARLRQYARWRAALDAFSTLQEQAEHPSVDAARTDALLLRVDGLRMLEGFAEGETAQRVRQHAARLSGAHTQLPANFAVGLLESEARVRRRFRVLFEPAVQSIPGDPADTPEHQDVLRLLDKEEAGIVADATRRIRTMLDEELDPANALQILPDLEAALDRGIHRLSTEVEPTPPALPHVEPPPPPDDPGLEALETLIAQRPSVLRLLPALLTIAFVTCVTGALVTLLFVDPQVASAAAPAPGGFSSGGTPSTSEIPWEKILPISIGLMAGWSVAAIWLLTVLSVGRHRLSLQLRRRKQELEALWARGGGGQEARQARDVLAVRRRRTALSLLRLLHSARDRLTALRAAIRHGKAQSHRFLTALRVRVGPSQEADDLSGLLGEAGPLHRSLLPGSQLARRVAAARVIRDPERWGQRILEGTWPADGIQEDLPATDLDAVARLCDTQLPDLGATDLLEGPEVEDVVRARLDEFLAGQAGALAFGVTPRDPHGDPVLGGRRDERLLIAPRALGWAFADDLPGQVWSDANTPWVISLRTWHGLTIAELQRGVS